MKHVSYHIGSILLSILLLSVPSTILSQVRQLGLGEIAASSSIICVATVTNVKSELDANKDVVTITTFKLEETIAGKPQKSFTIKQIGGEYKGVSHKLEHIRYFIKGERVLLTLYPDSKLGFTNPVGLNQGVWTIDALNQVRGVTPEQLMSVKETLPNYSIELKQKIEPIPKQKFVTLLKDLRTATAKGEVGR